MEERPAPSDNREHARVLMAQARHGSFMQTHDDDGAQAEQLSDAGHDCHHMPRNLSQENHTVKASLQAILGDKAGAAKGFDGGRSEEAEAPASETLLCTHVDACRDTSSNRLDGGCIEGGEASADVASEPHGTLQQHSWRCLVTVFLAALGELGNLLQLYQHVQVAYPDSLAQQAPRSHLLERLKQTLVQLQQLGRRLATHAMHSTVETAREQLPVQKELLEQLEGSALARGTGTSLLDQVHALFSTSPLSLSTLHRMGCQLEPKLEVLMYLHGLMRHVAACATPTPTTIIPDPATQQQEPSDVLLATHAAYSTARPLLSAQQMGMVTAASLQRLASSKQPPVKVDCAVPVPPSHMDSVQQPLQQQQHAIHQQQQQAMQLRQQFQQAQTPVPAPAPFFHPSFPAACTGTAALPPTLTALMPTPMQPQAVVLRQQQHQRWHQVPKRIATRRPSTTAVGTATPKQPCAGGLLQRLSFQPKQLQQAFSVPVLPPIGGVQKTQGNNRQRRSFGSRAVFSHQMQQLSSAEADEPASLEAEWGLPTSAPEGVSPGVQPPLPALSSPSRGEPEDEDEDMNDAEAPGGEPEDEDEDMNGAEGESEDANDGNGPAMPLAPSSVPPPLPPLPPLPPGGEAQGAGMNGAQPHRRKTIKRGKNGKRYVNDEPRYGPEYERRTLNAEGFLLPDGIWKGNTGDLLHHVQTLARQPFGPIKLEEFKRECPSTYHPDYDFCRDPQRRDCARPSLMAVPWATMRGWWQLCCGQCASRR